MLPYQHLTAGRACSAQAAVPAPAQQRPRQGNGGIPQQGGAGRFQAQGVGQPAGGQRRGDRLGQRRNDR